MVRHIGAIYLIENLTVKFEKFEEIREFPLFYDPKGDTLYVIFLGVAPNLRKQGIGQKLLEHAKDLAIKFNVNKMQLVAKEDLVHYYGNFNFEIIKELPSFLPDRNYKSTLMYKSIK